MAKVVLTMHILHVWDQAGVAYILAKYQQLQGHEAKVIMIRSNNKYGINEFYKEYILNVAVEEFVEKCIEKAKSADVIHIHSRIDILLKLRQKFDRSKKIILHYHGTDIRGLKKQKLPHRSELSDLAIRSIMMYRRIRDKILFRKRMHIKAQRMADTVIVSTPDLLQFVVKGVYLPNPIDTDHFKPNSISKNEQKEALTIDTEVTDIQWALDYCRKRNINLDIEVYNRVKNPIIYKDMPDLLKKYKIYVDIRYVNKTILQNLSKTALEALACGLRVLDYQLKYHQNLPREHDPINVISGLSIIYSK
jgi:glycosyltransferase involved in cell wall biosynthesis